MMNISNITMSLDTTIQQFYQSPEAAAEQLVRTVEAHKADPTLICYRFFEEQIALSRYAADALENVTVDAETEAAIEYANLHFW
jgi:hypothetical protein